MLVVVFSPQVCMLVNYFPLKFCLYSRYLIIFLYLRAETLANLEQAQRISAAERQASGPRAEFWKLRGLRGAKKNVRRTRDDLLQLTIQGKFPAYEKVVLREG